MYDPVFPVDLMCSFGEELARRLLAHDILLAFAVDELVRWIGLPKAKLYSKLVSVSLSVNCCIEIEELYLLHINRGFDLRYILINVLGQVVQRDGLPNRTRHIPFPDSLRCQYKPSHKDLEAI